MSEYLPTDIIAEMRANLRANLARQSLIPAEKIDEVVDLGMHAAVTGFDACMRIALRTSPDPRVGITVSGPALSLLAFFVDRGLASLKSLSAELGHAHGEFAMRVGGGTVQ